MNSATEEKFLERLQERLNMMKKRAFFNPKTLNGMREDSVYALNIDEFWHHTKPYVHKIFVIYLTNLDSGDQELVYAKSCSPKRVDSQENLTNSMETAYSIVAMLKEVPENVRQTK